MQMHPLLITQIYRHFNVKGYIGMAALLMLSLTSCSPDLDEVTWMGEQKNIRTTTPIQHIEMIDDDRGYAVGGKQFGLGFAAFTEDGWETGTVDSLSVEIILDVACREGQCLGAGFFSRIYLIK